MPDIHIELLNRRTAKAAAKKFSEKWLARSGDEKQECQQFWTELLRTVYGVINPEDYIRFEAPVEVGHMRYIDAHIPSTRVIIEQKSSNINLDDPQLQAGGVKLTPYEQAKRYSDNLSYDERIRWIVTCNFREFRVHDMTLSRESERAIPVSVISLNELSKHFHRLNFLVDSQSVRVAKEKEISMEAGEIIARIYSALLKHSHTPNDPLTLKWLNKFCVRLVFCLYAEDSGLFEPDQFLNYVSASHTPDHLRQRLLALFIALNRPKEQRDPYDEELLSFPYVNGGLFADENMVIPSLDENIRNLIQEHASAEFDWKNISPTIFGALFESTLNPITRRIGGMHYTSIENIHKVIDPLFLHELRAEFSSIQNSEIEANNRKRGLIKLQDKLASLTILDPACGSGNFLTETFISLRRLENDIIRALIALDGTDGQSTLFLTKVSIQQFLGIEINDFAVAVAKTALWIADSQMWEETQEIIHNPAAFLPLKSHEGIREANALRVDWLDNAPNRKLNYIIGNPPFEGARKMTDAQKEDLRLVLAGFDQVGYLDYVAAWYKKAADIMVNNTATKTAFVSTNSITQGQQVAPLWRPLAEMGCHIDFAHSTFKWKSDAKKSAAVHCVIIGLSCGEQSKTRMLIDNEGKGTPAAHINFYLANAADVFVEQRRNPLCDVPKIGIGNQIIDDSNYLFTESEKKDFVALEPCSASYFKIWIGADELINGKKRFCLWLGDCSPAELAKMPLCMSRVNAVRAFRQESSRKATRLLANSPTRFGVENMPDEKFIVMPRHPSQNYNVYVLLEFVNYPKSVLASDAALIIRNASLYHFGVLSSRMHMVWMSAVCGRWKSDFRYSAEVVYNNFPWPHPTEEQKNLIERCAQEVLDARALYPDCSLGDMYHSKKKFMPDELQKAHKNLDKAVEKAYCRDKFTDDMRRLSYLLEMYKNLTQRE